MRDIYYMILSYLFTEFISWIFHLVDKTTDLLLMSLGLNHERFKHAPTQCSSYAQFHQFVETALRKVISSVRLGLISVTYPSSISNFLSCTLAREAFLQSYGKKKHLVQFTNSSSMSSTQSIVESVTVQDFYRQSLDCRIFLFFL